MALYTGEIPINNLVYSSLNLLSLLGGNCAEVSTYRYQNILVNGYCESTYSWMLSTTLKSVLQRADMFLGGKPFQPLSETCGNVRLGSWDMLELVMAVAV